MLKSMTGFGNAAGEVRGVQYDVELRSVNNRYLKIALRVPESLQSLEPSIERRVRSRLQRGSVSLAVRMKLSDEKATYRVNAKALSSYLDQLRPLETEANPMLRLDIGSLLQLPGVCVPPPLEELAETTGEGLLALVDRAMDSLVRMRLTEGKAIVEDLQANVSLIRRNLDVIAERTGEVIKVYHERLAERVRQLLANAKIDIDQEMLAREVAIFADRSDIAEELSRLSTHLKEFVKACEADEPGGRKLDFMAQEMLREANTIASKGSDAEIARAVVEIKTAIDRIKEQAANVE